MKNEPQVICITETLPKNQVNYCSPIELGSLNFTSYHCNKSRGVSIYVNTGLKSEEIKINTDYTESIWVAVEDGKYNILVGCIYRSPNSSSHNSEKLIDLLEEVSKLKYNAMVIVGDFNYKEIDWENNIVRANENNAASYIYDKINDLFLTQLIKEPTRYREGETSNLLDWVLTTNPERIDSIEVGPPLGEKGDHCIIISIS